MNISEYDPTNDLRRLREAGATHKQIHEIITVRSRLWPMRTRLEALERDAAEKSGPMQEWHCPLWEAIQSWKASAA